MFEKKSYDVYISCGRGRDCRSVPPPPPKSEKLLYKSAVFLERYRLSERSQKSKKYLVKNVKNLLAIEILFKKCQNLLDIFQMFLALSVQTRKIKHEISWISLRDGTHSSNLDELNFFYKVQSFFSKNPFPFPFQFHRFSNSPFYPRQFLSFLINFSTR